MYFVLEQRDGNIVHLKYWREPNAGICLFPAIPFFQFVFLVLCWILNKNFPHYALWIILGSFVSWCGIWIVVFIRQKRELDILMPRFVAKISLDELPDRWIEVTVREASLFESELAKEISQKHPLAGVFAKCISRIGDRDDFLFALGAHEKPLAIVHLTWSKETDPEFPQTTFFDSEEDFLQNWKKIFD